MKTKLVGVLPWATKHFTRLVKKSGMKEATEPTVPKSCKLLKCRLLRVPPWEH